MARSREEYLKAKREGMARHRAANHEAINGRRREQYAADPDRWKASLRAYYGRRFFWGRATKLKGPGRATFRELAALWKLQRGYCAMTGARLTRATAELDHRLPKARGGSDEITNLRWTTRAANQAKRDLTDAEFMELCKSVVAHG